MSHQNQLNIKAVYDLATIKEKEDGRLWYPQALQIARGLAARYCVSTECAAGVLAALSPRNKWNRNCVDAEALISTFKADPESAADLKVCTFGANKAKALRILTENPIKSERVLEILSGPKLKEFYSCIMGLPEVCIDGHAFSLWDGGRITLAKIPSIGVKLRREIKADYESVATDLNIPGYELQAITWVAWRRIHGVG